MLGNKLPHSVSAYMLHESTFYTTEQNTCGNNAKCYVFYIHVFIIDVYNKQSVETAHMFYIKKYKYLLYINKKVTWCKVNYYFTGIVRIQRNYEIKELQDTTNFFLKNTYKSLQDLFSGSHYIETKKMASLIFFFQIFWRGRG